MENKNRALNCKLNCLLTETDSVYHQAAVKLGLADSEMGILYMLYEKGGKRLLSEIVKTTGISKQTVNSALRKLENEEVVVSEQSGKRAKVVCLTKKGQEVAEKTVARLFDAECSVYAAWTEDEVETYVRLMEKYNDDLRKQIEKL